MENRVNGRKLNRGFTLVELIVALAIASIIVIVVGTVLVTSARSYSSANAETSVQAKAQILMNQIEDLIIDTTGSADYGHRYSDGGDVTWGSLSDNAGVSYFSKTLRLCNEKKIYDLEWQSGEGDEPGEIKYIEYETSDGEKPDDGGTTPEIMSEGVESFSCDLSSLSSNRVIGVDIVLRKGQRRYHAYKNISIRNDIIAVGDTVSSNNEVRIKLISPQMTVEPNADFPMYGAIAEVISGAPSTEVYYKVDTDSVTEKSSTKIADDHKTLHVDTKEMSPKIIIRAYSPDKGPDKDYVIISAYNRRVKQLTKIDVVSDKGFVPGAKVTVSVTMDVNPGFNDTEEDTRKLYAMKWDNIYKVDPDTAVRVAYPEIKTNNSPSFSFIIPDDVKNGTVYEFRTRNNQLLHPTDTGGLSSRKKSYTVNSIVENDFYKSFIVEGGKNGDTPIILPVNQIVYRGMNPLPLSGNSLPGAETEVHFYYRAKENRIYDNYYKDSYNPLSSFKYKEDAKLNWNKLTSLNDVTNKCGWTEITDPNYQNKSITLPETLFTSSPVNEDYRYQLIMIKKNDDGSSYSRCGMGEFVIPAFRLQINGEHKKSYSYKLFMLAGNDQFPVVSSNYIKIGQMDRAFAGTVIDNRDNSIGTYDAKLELYANSSSETDKNKARKLDEDDDKLITGNLAEVLSASFRINKLSNFFKYPDPHNTSDQKWDRQKSYRIHVVHSYKDRDPRYLNGENFSKFADGTNLYNKSPYIQLDLRYGNAMVKYAKWKDGTDPATRKDDNTFRDIYEKRAAYIPAPGSEDDLLNWYSLKQLKTYYRPANTLEPVYINTLNENWVPQKKPYLIQMKVVNGVRWLRMWFADPDTVKDVNDHYFTANKWIYSGEYKYNSDTELWDFQNANEPSIY